MLACHMNIYVSEIRITLLDQDNKPIARKLPYNIDGIEKVEDVSRIVINRLVKQDGEQASIPI